MNDILLSILICTIPERADKLEKLMKILRPQIPVDGSVEVIIQEEAATKDGGPTIGTNRNNLLERAAGDYVCFVDDDDLVTHDYIGSIIGAIHDKPDVVGMKGAYKVGDSDPQTFIHSKQYDHWFEKDGIYYRCPNHLNPVKRELAMRARFTEKNQGEDYDYSTALYPLLTTEVMIDQVIYHYIKA